MENSDPMLDPVLGIYSRAAWDRLAEAEISRARRYGDRLTVALVAVDPLTTAFEGSDDYLAEVSSTLTERCRREDIVGRLRDNVIGVLAVTLNGESGVLVEALEAALEQYSVTIAGTSHRLTRPFAATIRDAEAALVVAERQRRRTIA